MSKVLILGAGIMGTALSVPLCQNKHSVNLWGTEFDAEVLEIMARTRRHIHLDILLPSDVMLFSAGELDKAFQNVDVVLLAVASSAIRSVTRKLVPFVKDGMIIVNAAKGLEEDSRTGKVLTMPDVIESELPQVSRGESGFCVKRLDCGTTLPEAVQHPGLQGPDKQRCYRCRVVCRAKKCICCGDGPLRWRTEQSRC